MAKNTDRSNRGKIPTEAQTAADGFEFDGTVLRKYKGKSKKVLVPQGVTAIDDWAFEELKSLTAVVIPDSVAYIGEYVFWGCDNLACITVHGGNKRYRSEGNCIIETENGTLIAGCGSSVIPEGGSVTRIGEAAFGGCKSLRSITVPDSVTHIGEWAFKGCENLADVNLSDSVETVSDGAFAYCDSLVSVTIPSGVKHIGNELFRGCDNLASITVAAANKRYRSAGNCIIDTETKTLIAGCGSSVIPEDDSVEIIADGAFNGCGSLESIAVPKGVTHIGDVAFAWCSILTSIRIPKSITRIGEWALCDCVSLTSIKFDGTVAEWNAVEKRNGWDLNTGNYTVTCTDGIA